MQLLAIPSHSLLTKLLIAVTTVILTSAVIVIGHLLWHRSQIALDHRIAPDLVLPNQPLYEGPYFLEKIASPTGFERIVCLNHWVDGGVLASQQNGKLWQLDLTTPTSSRVILDLSQQVFAEGESGLFGVAPHPDFKRPDKPGHRQLFVFYCARKEPGKNTNRLSRFTWDEERRVVDPASETILIDQADEDNWHNGGALAFGQDGFLYVTVGDEGGANEPFENTQRIERDLFSGVLRIDVDRRGGSISHPITKRPATGITDHYFIPNDNPWVGRPGALEEFYAIGLRSPHNLFGDARTGELFLTDVGQGSREELNRLVRGANYGWSWLEGDVRFERSRFGGVAPDPLLGSNTPPLLAYPHINGNTCIIGGTVYRGQKFPELNGRILIGDLGSGRLWAVQPSTTQNFQQTLVASVESKQSRSLVGIATSGDGDVVVATLTGELFLLRQRQAIDRSPELPQTLSGTGLFTDLGTLAPAKGVIPYAINSPLWSDGAHKQRWMAIPGDGSAKKPVTDRIIVGKDGTWAFPVGSTFIKHFSMPIDARNPAALKRLETRIIVRETSGGIWGVTYRWNAEGTEAYLLPSEGLTEELTIFDVDGHERKTTWAYPAREGCLSCHNAAAGGILGLSTSQLNRSITYTSSSRTGDQLRTLNEVGYLSRDPGRLKPIRVHSFLRLDRMMSPDDPDASVGARAEAYLAANCAHCHRPGYLRIDMDLRHGIDVSERAVMNVKSEIPTANASSKRIDLAHPEQSEIHHRMTRLEPGVRMPLLGSHRVDEAGARLILEWARELAKQNPTH